MTISSGGGARGTAVVTGGVAAAEPTVGPRTLAVRRALGERERAR